MIQSLHNLLSVACLAIASSASQATIAPGQLNSGPRGEDLIVSVGGLPSHQVRVFDARTGKLKRELNHPAWVAVNSRVVAIDDHGHLWVGDDETNSLYQFDRDYKFLRSFPVDTSCIGPPAGNGVRCMAFSPNGELFLVGSWQSGTFNYLFEVDPQTERTVRCEDLDSLAGAPFEPARLTVDPRGLIHVGAWSGGQSSRVLVVDPNAQPAGFQGIEVLNPGLEPHGSSIQVLPSDAIVFGTSTFGLSSGSIWLSDPARANWTQIASCPSHGGMLDFTVGHGRVFTNGTPCDVGQGFIAVYELNGTFSGSIDLNQGSGPPMTGFQGAVIRH